MRYLISHLDGWKLDLAVALALGYVVVEKRPSGTVYMCWEPGKTLAYKGMGTLYINSNVDDYRFSPTMEPRIALWLQEQSKCTVAFLGVRWRATRRQKVAYVGMGNSIEVAICRYFVMTKFGLHVNLPDEVL